ncbi:MFS transporter [Penicillium cosmopolitanum]|uniref:MFS transporter n=1 Tax=Penicillium cosmopolitanum TaxID=1131564 RepID=A0A9W9VT91_9EURO|nr:MFS transporter [Penicillium cosmopolitanum]KAJ5388922.1 MFS transporter [Penicillium cosmopolitanum]
MLTPTGHIIIKAYNQDQTIIATAIPTITSHFQSVDDIGCSQLLFGKLYTLLPIKWTFFGAVLIFQIGLAICGASPNSLALIIGRAVAGVGGAGIFSGALIVITNQYPSQSDQPSQVSRLLALVFDIDIPVVAAAIPLIILFLPSQKPRIRFKQNIWGTVAQCDLVGTILFVPSIICLLMALQWGGSQYRWSDGRTIDFLTAFSVLLVAWIMVQWRSGDNATVPLRILRQRSITFSTLYIFLGSGSFVLLIYYLPIWFQEIKFDTADQSGIHSQPIVLSVVVFAIASGLSGTVVGYYTPFMIAGSMGMAIGAGLFLLSRTNTSLAMWLGFQVVFGAGVGKGLELPSIAVQTALPEKDVSIGTCLVVFTRSLGGAILYRQDKIFSGTGSSLVSLPGSQSWIHISSYRPE